MAFTRPRAAQINFDATNISDSLIRINSSETGDNTNDLGIVFERGNHTNAALVFDESADVFRLISTTHSGDGDTTDINISAHHDLHVGGLTTSGLTIGATAITATAAELNLLDGVTATTAEINYLGGVTSAIQTQIDNISSSFTLAADSGSNDTFTTGQTLTIAGGTGIDTTVSDNNISIAIDSIVATLTGTQTLTNKTINTASNTITIVEADISDLGAYATLASPTLTGTPAAPTATAGTNTTQIATTAFVSTAVANIVDTAPAALDTLNELAAALGDDANFATTTATSLGEKLVKASNLSDLTDASAARTNLGLGTAATTAATAYATAAQGSTADSATQPGDNVSTLTNDSGYITASTTDTLTNKTLTSPSVNTEAKMLAQAELEFYDSDSSNYVSFRGPATVATNITWTLPNTDGTDGQMLSTNGAGTLAWADGGGGGGSGSSYPNSTFSTVPGTDGDFDMSYNVAQTSQETPFEAGGTDAFGVNLGSVFSLMDPIGTIETIDYGDSEAYVGA